VCVRKKGRNKAEKRGGREERRKKEKMNEEINIKVHFWKKPKITVLETTGKTHTHQKKKKPVPYFQKFRPGVGKKASSQIQTFINIMQTLRKRYRRE